MGGGERERESRIYNVHAGFVAVASSRRAATGQSTIVRILRAPLHTRMSFPASWTPGSRAGACTVRTCTNTQAASRIRAAASAKRRSTEKIVPQDVRRWSFLFWSARSRPCKSRSCGSTRTLVSGSPSHARTAARTLCIGSLGSSRRQQSGPQTFASKTQQSANE